MNLTFYKVTYPNGKFYIGSTTSDNIEGYLKEKHKNLIKKDNSIKIYSFNDLVIETKTNFNSEQELKSFEKSEIKKSYKKDVNCLNSTTQTSCIKKATLDNICSECGGKLNHHKKSCPHYKKIVCEECGGKGGHHLKSCSKFRTQEKCSECGSYTTHKEWCTKYKKVKVCSECGKKYNHHLKTCSYYKSPKPCEECGGILGHHKKFCSKYKVCPECKAGANKHKKWCSKYKQPRKCEECGGSYGKHKKTCSKFKKREN